MCAEMCFNTKRMDTDTHSGREKPGDAGGETGVTQPYTGDHQGRPGPPEVQGGKGGPSPRAVSGTTALRALGFGLLASGTASECISATSHQPAVPGDGSWDLTPLSNSPKRDPQSRAGQGRPAASLAHRLLRGVHLESTAAAPRSLFHAAGGGGKVGPAALSARGPLSGGTSLSCRPITSVPVTPAQGARDGGPLLDAEPQLELTGVFSKKEDEGEALGWFPSV